MWLQQELLPLEQVDPTCSAFPSLESLVIIIIIIIVIIILVIIIIIIVIIIIIIKVIIIKKTIKQVSELSTVEEEVALVGQVEVRRCLILS